MRKTNNKQHFHTNTDYKTCSSQSSSVVAQGAAKGIAWKDSNQAFVFTYLSVLMIDYEISLKKIIMNMYERKRTGKQKTVKSLNLSKKP